MLMLLFGIAATCVESVSGRRHDHGRLGPSELARLVTWGFPARCHVVLVDLAFWLLQAVGK